MRYAVCRMTSIEVLQDRPAFAAKITKQMCLTADPIALLPLFLL